MCELGWKSLGVLELTALPSIAKELWVPRLQQTDVLLVGDGLLPDLGWQLVQHGPTAVAGLWFHRLDFPPAALTRTNPPVKICLPPGV